MSQILLYLGAILIWGSTWFIIRFQLGVVAPQVSVAYRFAIAALLLFGWCRFRKSKIRFTLEDHAFMLLQGLFLFGLNYHLAYLANGLLTSGVNAVIFSSVMIFNMINAAIFFRSRIQLETVLGAALGLTGIASVFWSELSSIELAKEPLIGMAYSLGAAISASYGNMISARHQNKGLPVTETNAFAMGYGALLTFLLLIFSKKEFNFDWHLPYIGSLIYLSIFGSIFAFGIYLKLLGRIGPQRAGYALVITPIVALLISTIYEGFVWTRHAYLGVILIFLGNILIMSKKRLSTQNQVSVGLKSNLRPQN